MNALGLPGASIDGILGFTVLARFRLELDPTRDRMTWTRLDFDPPDPPAPRRGGGRAAPGRDPGDERARAARQVRRRSDRASSPRTQLHPRGFLGLELAEAPGAVRVARVLPGSPAAARPGVAGGRPPASGSPTTTSTSLKAAREAVAAVEPGDRVADRRSAGAPRPATLTLTAGEGL